MLDGSDRTLGGELFTTWLIPLLKSVMIYLFWNYRALWERVGRVDNGSWGEDSREADLHILLPVIPCFSGDRGVLLLSAISFPHDRMWIESDCVCVCVFGYMCAWLCLCVRMHKCVCLCVWECEGPWSGLFAGGRRRLMHLFTSVKMLQWTLPEAVLSSCMWLLLWCLTTGCLALKLDGFFCKECYSFLYLSTEEVTAGIKIFIVQLAEDVLDVFDVSQPSLWLNQDGALGWAVCGDCHFTPYIL